jgi:hypothetical protein
MKVISVWRFKAEWSWTNWTFGLWYAKFGAHHMFGVDMGPFEVMWKQQYIRLED